MTNVYVIWEDMIEAEKVVIPGVWESLYGNTHILEITEFATDYSDESTAYIGELYFHFSNCDTNYTLDEAISIVKEYIPIETIQKYYYEYRSFFRTDEDGSTYYHKWYDQREEITDIPEKLPNGFDVVFWTDANGNVTDARIATIAVATMDDTQEWEYDILGS